LIQSNSVEEKKDELLLNVDVDDTEHQGNNTSNKILDDLNDLRFDEKTDIDGKENRIIIIYDLFRLDLLSNINEKSS
jgi:hypothetical protein